VRISTADGRRPAASWQAKLPGGSAPAAALLIAAVLLGVVLRLLWVDAKPLWNDEAFSLRTAVQPLGPLVASIALDVHPPLYFLTLHGWLRLVPADQTARVFSVLAGSAALPIVFLLARPMIGPFRACIATAICAVLPFYVSWSQIGRSYAFLLLVSLLAVLAAARLLEALEAGRWRPAAGVPVRLLGLCAFYVLSAGAVLWSHNLALFLVVAINAVAGWRLLSGQLRGGGPLAIWSLCQLLVIGSWLPWLPVVLGQVSNLGAPQFAVSLAATLERVEAVFGGFMLWKLGALAAAFGVAGAVLGAASLPLRRADAQLVLATLILPILACLALFVAGKPAFGYAIGTLIWAPGLVAVLMAAALRRPDRRRPLRTTIGALVAAGFVLLSARGLANWYAVPNPGWDALAARIAGELRPGDAVVAQTELLRQPASELRGEVPMHAFLIYWERLRQGASALPAPLLPADGSDKDLLRWMSTHARIWVPQTPGMAPTTLAMRMVALAASRPDEWAVATATVERLLVTELTRQASGSR
jgi:hypothetical protein